MGLVAESWSKFMFDCVLPHVQPYPHPRSVIILDNASFHFVPEVFSMIDLLEAFIIFLPPYSPDFNPIENVWNRIKSYLKRKREDADRQPVLTIINAIEYDNQTSNHAKALAHCGYS
jgi:transposase